MKLKSCLPFAAACGLVLTLCVSALAQAATLNVPAQYATIQSAVNAASNGDTVLIADGTYTGPGNVDIDFGGKNLTVTSQHGAASTIINRQGTSSASHRGFILQDGKVYTPPALASDNLASGDIFVSSSNSGPPSTIEEYTPAGQHVRSIPVPDNTGSYAANGTEYLRGIAVNDAGQIVGFNGTFSPELATFFPNTRTFTAQTAPGWKIANNVTYGSVGVFQGYSFVVTSTGFSSTGIIRFNPDGTSQTFGTATNYAKGYLNLRVGLDGKLYVLYSGGGSYLADVYDPVSLQLLRTVTLQLPSAQGGSSADLRSLAVDASGSIYTIDLYNYVYHLDANGTFLQSASHGHGGYTTDIKIDPVTGRILISVSGYGGVILQTDADLSAFTTLITLDPTKSGSKFIAFGNTKLDAVLNTAHILWSNSDGRVSVWNLSDPNPAASCQVFGPYPGWTANALAEGPDGHVRLLWNNTDGRISVWNLADAQPDQTCLLYGPYSGWTAKSIAVGPDNAAHLLWDNTGGPVSLWNLTDAQPDQTCSLFGPYAGWSGTAIALGPDNHERLLWDNTDGRASVWNLADAQPDATCNLYGPYGGWTANAIAVGPNNAAHLLWDNVHGPVSLWNLADADPTASYVIAGPYSGWSGTAIAIGANNQERLLWDNSAGPVSLWNLSDPQPDASCLVYGPFDGWTAVGVSAP